MATNRHIGSVDACAVTRLPYRLLLLQGEVKARQVLMRDRFGQGDIKRVEPLHDRLQHIVRDFL
jgi:hypothetical protein